MTLTAAQFRWLRWLRANGGKARPHGLKLVAGDQETNTGAPVSFIHLVAKGAVAGRDGYLEITEYGERMLKP